MKASPRRRDGGTALVALICLSVIAIVVAGLFRIHADRRDQMDRIERRCQADWLVESGLERAWARSAVDPDYDGEDWSIPAEALGGRSATVAIAVETPEEDGPRVVRIRAEYPADGRSSDRVRVSKTYRIRTAQPAEESSR